MRTADDATRTALDAHLCPRAGYAGHGAQIKCPADLCPSSCPRWGPVGLSSQDVLARYGSVVEWVVSRLPGPVLRAAVVGREDLRQEGLIALLAAGRTFDPSRGATFRTYATRCVENAVASALRSADPLTSSMRRDAGAIARAQESLLQTGAALGDDRALAEMTGLVPFRVRAVLSAVHRSLPGGDGEDPQVADRTAPDPAETVIDAEDRRRVLEAVAELPARMRTVILLRVVEGLSNQDVAEMMGVTPGRTSQMLTQAVETLRSTLRDED